MNSTGAGGIHASVGVSASLLSEQVPTGVQNGFENRGDGSYSLILLYAEVVQLLYSISCLLFTVKTFCDLLFTDKSACPV